MTMDTEARRLPLVGLVAGLSVLGWLLLAWMVLDMGHPWVQLTMPGTADWSALNVGALFGMWVVMMAAMMLPSSLPMMLTFARLNRAPPAGGRARAFVAAYLLVWSAFAAGATALQWLLQWLDWVDPMITSTSVALNGSLLLLAGLYQASPLKRMCLATCRSPLAFLLGDWRPHMRGAFVMGVRHGLLCTGCCWALMLLLFVGGAMNIAWVAALSVAVAIEKLAPGGEWLGKAMGLLLVAAGLAKIIVLLRPGLS